MHVHWSILHRTTHFLLCRVHKSILDISGSSVYLFREGDSLSQINEGPAPPTTKKHHRDSSFDGDQGKHDLAASSLILQFLDPWVRYLTPSFQPTRIPKENFLHSKEIPLRYSVLTQLCQFSTVSLHSFLSMLTIFSRHFCLFRICWFSRGTVYFVINPVRGQLHQLPCLASNTSHNQSVFFSTQL